MFELPPLAYGFTALCPTISEATLRTHYGKHHARYVKATNELMAASGDLEATLERVVAAAEAAGERKLFNNAAQAWNHGFFWACMRPEASRPDRALVSRIHQDYGDLAKLRSIFTTEGANHFGSGWVWLIAKGERLSVMSTHDALTPITSEATTPLLVCDLWEHAYYLDHKNDRAAFLGAWWDLLVDWDFVSSQYVAARTRKPAWSYPQATAA